MTRINNPILRVEAAVTDQHPRELGGFGEPKEIVAVTQELRTHLANRARDARASLASRFEAWPDLPAVVNMTLRNEALAKSHRPLDLLTRVGMNPIGALRIGELLLPALPQSLNHLALVIESAQSKKIRANLSTIAEMRPYSQADAIGGDPGDQNLRQDLTAWIEAGKPLVLELFRHDEGQVDHAIQQQLQGMLRALHTHQAATHLHALGRYGRIVTVRNVDDVLTLAGFPGVRSLLKAPEFTAIDILPQSFADLGAAAPGTLPQPDPDLPVVGVIDSGVQPGDLALSPWLSGQVPYLLPPETDYLHGTFVTGLIAGARLLNGGNTDFPDVKAKVFSVGAIGTGSTSMSELLDRIIESVSNHPDIKVWNCSFGSTTPGPENAFGYFAQELDAIATERGVLFVIAAGNYQTPPLRSWPVPAGFSGSDRISEPAESIRALTIGSVAHLPNLVAASAPSPFSRRGPGPAKTPKPELTHFGGNCDSNGQFIGTGVRSLLPGGRLGESIGTSFSTPLASVIAAHTWWAMQNSGQPVRPDLVKALLIHAAALNAPKRTPEERHYHGFGIPESPMETLFCAPDSFTLLFEADIMDGVHWAKTPYPVPACLRTDPTHFRGEIIMTLVYSPPVDGAAGEEYVRANVNASFGSYDQDDEGKWHHHGLVPLEKPAWLDLHEEALIDHGFKWSPVKVYRKRFARGVKAETLRLQLDLLRRAGEMPQPRPQGAYVLVTLRGLAPDQPVYQHGITALRQSNWVTQSIAQPVHIQI